MNGCSWVTTTVPPVARVIVMSVAAVLWNKPVTGRGSFSLVVRFLAHTWSPGRTFSISVAPLLVWTAVPATKQLQGRCSTFFRTRDSVLRQHRRKNALERPRCPDTPSPESHR